MLLESEAVTRRLVPLLFCGVLLAQAPRADAKRNGFAGDSCDGCHKGGQRPTVKVTADPVKLDPGMSTVLTVHIQAINGNIVIIADRDIPIFRIEEDIAKRYIAIAETLRMELQKAVREFEPRGGEHSKGRLYAARHQIDDTLETLFSQQHYVAKPRHTLSRGEFYWPEKFFVRWSFSDERL